MYIKNIFTKVNYNAVVKNKNIGALLNAGVNLGPPCLLASSLVAIVPGSTPVRTSVFAVSLPISVLSLFE